MRKKNGDKYKTEKELNIVQLHYRIHMNDRILLKKLLRDDNLSFQILVDAASQAYMRGDPAMLRVIEDWKDLNIVPDDIFKKGGVLLSRRERMEILKDLEDSRK